MTWNQLTLTKLLLPSLCIWRPQLKCLLAFFLGGVVFCFSKINMLSPYFMGYSKEERLSQSYVYSPRRSDNYCPWETKIPEKTWQHNLYNFLHGFFLEFNAISQSEAERRAWSMVWCNSCLWVWWEKKTKKRVVPWVLFGWEEHKFECKCVLLYATAVREKWLQQFVPWAISYLQTSRGKNEPSVTAFTSEIRPTATRMDLTSGQLL